MWDLSESLLVDAVWVVRLALAFHLTLCINQMILESHPPHQIVDLKFIITDWSIKWTVL